MLIKIPDASGGYRYAFPKEHGMILSQGRLERTFQDSILSIGISENLVVIRTLPGTAQAVAYGIDYMKWPEVLGTVAGDDTIFVAVDNRDNPPLVVSPLMLLFRIWYSGKLSFRRWPTRSTHPVPRASPYSADKLSPITRIVSVGACEVRGVATACAT